MPARVEREVSRPAPPSKSIVTFVEAEAVIQVAVGGEARDEHVGPGRTVLGPRAAQDDLAVGLHDRTAGARSATGIHDSGHGDAALAEGRVEVAVGSGRLVLGKRRQYQQRDRSDRSIHRMSPVVCRRLCLKRAVYAARDCTFSP